MPNKSGKKPKRNKTERDDVEEDLEEANANTTEPDKEAANGVILAAIQSLKKDLTAMFSIPTEGSRDI